jgi:stress-induced morphogen
MTKDQMHARLQAAFPDSRIEITDLTGTQDHWEVFIESSTFAGQSRIQCHQMVNQVFAAELKTGEVHALSIRTQLKI